jgi:hypothetical protein
MKTLLLLSFITFNLAHAEIIESVEISCNDLNDETKSVEASVYRDTVTNQNVGAVVKLVENKKNGKILKTWKAVPDFSNPFFTTLKSKEVTLVAWGDDVGAMSSLTVRTKFGVSEKQLQCDVEFNLDE